jgi:formate-dependent nitrite reductase membrane component NrfD
MTPVPSTLFTEPPDWRWLIVVYFFVGGLAGGCYFLAVLIDLFGRATDRPLARLGYLVAFPAVIASGLLLTVDLTRPERFWHMLLQSERLVPMLKPWSPMSVGSWALLLFGGITFLTFLAALADVRPSWPRWLQAFRPPGVLGIVVAAVGGLLGFFVAGYTGVLLAVTNRPIWSDTSWLGLTFLISAASSSAALLLLLAWRRRRVPDGTEALARFDAWLLVIELVALAGLVLSLGSLARVWLSAWGALLVLGVVGIGILVPLVLHWRPRALGALTAPVAAVLVLAGSFLLRVVIVLSSEAV